MKNKNKMKDKRIRNKYRLSKLGKKHIPELK